MSRWLVTQNDDQFSVGSLSELRSMARAGRLGAADMIQPPGASDWLYASEIPELKDHLGGGVEDDDLDYQPKRGLPAGALAVVLVAVIAIGSWLMYGYIQQLPDADNKLFDNLSFSEMVVTSADARLRAEPDANSGGTAIEKDTVLDLLSKRGDFYRARHAASGTEGWVGMDEVIPMYLLGGGDVMSEYDPLYNPDRYLFVQNASWLQLPDHRQDQVTVFQFMLRNTARYDVTDLVMVATIKDAKGHELEKVEFRVEGVVPAKDETMVGTLALPDDVAKRLITTSTVNVLALQDPDVQLNYQEGVEVQMKTPDFTEAQIDIIELRAIPEAAEG